MVIPGHGGDIGDMFARLKVRAVFHGNGKPFCDMFDSRDVDRFAHDVEACRHHDFRIVEEGVKALIYRVFCRNGGHICRVDNGKNGLQKLGVAKVYFLMGVLSAYNAPFVHFASGSACRCDRYDKERLVLNRLAFSCSAVNVVPKAPAVRGHCRNRNGRVEYGAASQGDNEIASVLTCECAAFLTCFCKRILHDFCKFHAGFFVFVDSHVIRAVLVG